MTGHEQAFHQLAFDDVSFHDLGDIGLASHPVPDSFRVNDEAWAIFAMIQATGLIGADNPLEPKPPDFLFEEGVQFHRPVRGTTPPWVFLGPFVNADENMMLESAHVYVTVVAYAPDDDPVRS